MSRFSQFSPTTPKPWSLWPTLGISFLILVFFFLISVIVSLVYVGWEWMQNSAIAGPGILPEYLLSLEHNGTFLALSTLCSGTAGLVLVAIAIRARKGWTYRNYLNLHWPKGKALVIWNILLIGVVLLESQVANYFSKESDFLENIFASDQTNFFLLTIAVVIMAPVFEEILFRGFMFKGLEQTWLKTFGTILVTSGVWAVIHFQYEPFFMGVIFALGLLMGYARHVTKSLWIPISMHMFNNGLAMVGASAWLQGCILN